MKMDLAILCRKVELICSTVRATPDYEHNQVIVSFLNRPDIQIALLTSYQQRRLAEGEIDIDLLADLMNSVKMIANQGFKNPIIERDGDTPHIILNLNRDSEFGRWGQLRLAYLKQNSKDQQTMTDEELVEAMHQMDIVGDAMFHDLLQLEKEKNGITEELKEKDPLRWIVKMKQAEENAANEVRRRIIEH